ncbi:stage II sporulation protein R [Sporosarcina sp. ACRSL]|uniref:stage II sporulation protein R n=1 Tax=Sporosarcina sp. ACRSL TaxID=2918215 RepID=UPI001EF688CB|nr:stage II sporulation protein R [Sporosarcina sp. ACRSL]MCG7343899.1 stage II sporulation protein R [Sporosarcina sp. ACRSL]
MLQDYEISKPVGRIDSFMAVIEFILVLFLIQSALLLFSGQAEQDEEIRFRILSHSNAPADQKLKEEIQLVIEPMINQAIAQAESKSEIVDNLKAIEATILETAQSMADGQDVRFERKAALFPPKRSGFVITPQAPYDAYILTIGSGRGDNWWCSLFPKVCFPDKDVEKAEDEKVTFFIWEWIKSWFD